MNNSELHHSSLPKVIIAQPGENKLSDWFEKNKEELNKELNEHGVILFRGFDIDNADDFEDFLNVLDNTPIPYMFRSSPRTALDQSGKNIYNSTFYHNEFDILLHNESSYSRNWGMKIIFCCLQPPLKGGVTPIADSRKVLTSLPKELREKFEEKGVLYYRKLKKDFGMSWQESFQTEDKEEVKNICDEFDIRYKFVGEDELHLKWHKPAIYKHPETNDSVWFNHVYFFNKYSRYKELGLSYDENISKDFVVNNTYFGDGTAITAEEYLQIKKAYEENTCSIPYKKGDVLFIDNMLASHGRTPYEGERLIATAILEPTGDKEFINQ
nr:TauD/TfdA family dioxygenase [Tenacibaculum mesophilum]